MINEKLNLGVAKGQHCVRGHFHKLVRGKDITTVRLFSLALDGMGKCQWLYFILSPCY